MDGLYRITLPYACYGIIVLDGRVVEVAPIARWMMGRRLAAVEAWLHQKGGRLDWLSNDHDSSSTKDDVRYLPFPQG